MNFEEKSKIRKMRFKGESYTKIAETIGVSTNTIKSFCRRNNLQNTEYEDNKIQSSCKNCKLKLDKIRKNKKFCSDECRSKWWSKNCDKLRKVAIYDLKCKNCKIDFESYGNKNRLYCSRKCYFNHRYKTA